MVVHQLDQVLDQFQHSLTGTTGRILMPEGRLPDLLLHFNVFTGEEFDAPTKEDANRRAKSGNKVGVAFPHKEGSGFNIQLRSLPVDGKLVVLPANEAESEEPPPAPASTRDTRARR